MLKVRQPMVGRSIGAALRNKHDAMKTKTTHVSLMEVSPEHCKGNCTELAGVSSSDQAALRALIAQQSFFAGLTPDQFDVLAESALQLQYQAGEWIFEEGDPANRFFLILEGQVSLEAEAEDHSR